jgi:hypothetical protein
MTSLPYDEFTIDVDKLSDHQKTILQKILEINQPMSFGMIKLIVDRAKKGSVPEQMIRDIASMAEV